MVSKFEFLESHPLFTDLTEDELRALSAISKEYQFDREAVIAFKGDVADTMVMVKSGRLYGQSVDSRGIVRESRSYTAGDYPHDYFGATWLFKPGVHSLTITGAEPGRVIMIKNRDFLEFLADNPGALANLEPVYDDEGNLIAGLPQEAWEEADKLRPRDQPQRLGQVHLMPSELVEYYSRRSVWALFLELFGPIATLIVVTVLLLLIPDTTALFIFGQYGLIAIVWLVLGFIILFRLYDWYNDYFVITNKFIYRRDFNLRSFRTQYTKVPLEQVQSVTVAKPNFWANLFDFGSARITTAAQAGVVWFDQIDDPGEVVQALDKLRSRSRAYDSALAQTTMRQSLESYFDMKPEYEPVAGDEEEVEDEEEGSRFGGFGLGERIRRAFQLRLVDGDVITYRKNRLVLLREIGLPLLFLFLLLGSLALAAGALPQFSPIILGLGLVLVLVDLGWLIWQYEDWRNDLFQLTNQYVIDIDRKPFGFGESRSQAPLSNIQNINAIRPGFFATVFNYGNVEIETAGATANIIFEDVASPNQILRDIFERLDTVRESQRRREGANRREEYAVLLDVYKQELELDRIPRRTPPLDEEIGEE